MSVFLVPQQFYNDEKGRTYPKMRLYFYETNTFNFKNVYSDAARTQLLENPVIADGAGRLPLIYMDGDTEYRVWAKDRRDMPLSPYIDNYSPASVADELADRPTYEEFGDITLGRKWKAWSNTSGTAKWQKIATLNTTSSSYRGTINLATGNGFPSGADHAAYSMVINLTSGNKESINDLLVQAFLLGGTPSTVWRIKTKSLGSNIFELWIYCPSSCGGIANYLGEIPLTAHTDITGSEPAGDVYEKTVYKLSYTAL